jgi:hypothetical protein
MGLRSRDRAARSIPNAPDFLQLVDSALSLAMRRQVFTAEEAIELLEGVRNKVHDGLVEDAIARIAVTAEDSYRETPLVERGRVIDPLLDMRLTLSA